MVLSSVSADSLEGFVSAFSVAIRLSSDQIGLPSRRQ